MLVTRVRLRAFRSYAVGEAVLGPGLTVVHGRNGAGKTNLLEALYFGLTARSCRTGNEREVLHFGDTAARVEVEIADDDGAHELAVGFTPGEAKRLTVDGAPVERFDDAVARPLVSVFLPDRLELVKGAPALRRGHPHHPGARGAARARPAGRRRVAGALADAPCVHAGARAAQRAPRPRALGPCLALFAAGVGRRA